MGLLGDNMKRKSDFSQKTLLISLVLLVIIIFSIMTNSVPIVNEKKDQDPSLPVTLGPFGDLSKFSLSLKSDLPIMPEHVPRLKVERVPISNGTAETIAINAFNFTHIEKIEKKRTGSLAIIEGTKRLYFYGLNDIFYQTLNDTTIVNEWSDIEIKTIADDFFVKLYKYWRVPTEVKIEFNTIKPCYITVYDDGTKVVNKIGATYNVKLGDINLYGPGADFSLSIANGKVYDVELHIPSVSIKEYVDVSLSPQEAVNRFITGTYSTHELGYTELYGPVPKEGQVIIENVELVYYVDHHSDPPQTYLPLVYKISGNITVISPYEDKIISIDFHELIPVI